MDSTIGFYPLDESSILSRSTKQYMNWKLFIDDERSPPSDDWTVARSSIAAMALVKVYGMPMEISFDHDLSGDDTSMLFIYWMIERILDDINRIPRGFKYYVHSQNPVGKANIIGLMDSFLNRNSSTQRITVS